MNCTQQEKFTSTMYFAINFSHMNKSWLRVLQKKLSLGSLFHFPASFKYNDVHCCSGLCSRSLLLELKLASSHHFNLHEKIFIHMEYCTTNSWSQKTSVSITQLLSLYTTSNVYFNFIVFYRCKVVKSNALILFWLNLEVTSLKHITGM